MDGLTGPFQPAAEHSRAAPPSVSTALFVPSHMDEVKDTIGLSGLSAAVQIQAMADCRLPQGQNL